MALIHAQEHGYSVDPVLTVTGLLGILLTLHLVRALTVSESTARRWAAARSLPTTSRSLDEIQRHLRRLHWGRFVGTALLGAVSLGLLLGSRPTISFASLPLVVGVLVAELLVPQPRRGRVRAVVLQHRPSSYFAPKWALRITRALLVSGVVLAWGGSSLDSRPGFFLLHGAVLAVGVVTFEAALRRLTNRGLPERQDDLAVDSALRVADARSLTAAGLVFASIGFVLSAVPFVNELGGTGRVLFNVIGQLTAAAVVWAIVLARPQRSWRPA